MVNLCYGKMPRGQAGMWPFKRRGGEKWGGRRLKLFYRSRDSLKQIGGVPIPDPSWRELLAASPPPQSSPQPLILPVYMVPGI